MRGCLVSSDSFELSGGCLDGALAHHLGTVLRVKPGEELMLMNGLGSRRRVRVVSVSRNAVQVESEGNPETFPPPMPALTLFQCVAKPARMDWLVEKAAELGVTTLVPIVSRHCVVQHSEGTVVDRWKRLADSALEQCGSAWAMKIEPVCKWPSAVGRMKNSPLVFIAALSPSARPFRDALVDIGAARREVALVVGPEGDFAPDELSSALEAGAVPVSLGDRVLRTETAAIYGVSFLRAMWGSQPA